MNVVETLIVTCVNGHDTLFKFSIDDPVKAAADPAMKEIAFASLVSRQDCKACGVRLHLPLSDVVTAERLSRFYGVVHTDGGRQ